MDFKKCWDNKLRCKNVLAFILVLYIGAVFYVTIITRTKFDGPFFKLIPFWSWDRAVSDITEKNDYAMLRQIVMNVLMFTPIGVLLRLIKDLSCKKIFYLGFLLSFLIESLQLVLQVGLFEWDDMVHNATGCFLGALLALGIQRIGRQHSCNKLWNMIK